MLIIPFIVKIYCEEHWQEIQIWKNNIDTHIYYIIYMHI